MNVFSFFSLSYFVIIMSDWLIIWTGKIAKVIEWTNSTSEFRDGLYIYIKRVIWIDIFRWIRWVPRDLDSVWIRMSVYLYLRIRAGLRPRSHHYRDSKRCAQVLQPFPATWITHLGKHWLLGRRILPHGLFINPDASWSCRDAEQDDVAQCNLGWASRYLRLRHFDQVAACVIADSDQYW